MATEEDKQRDDLQATIRDLKAQKQRVHNHRLHVEQENEKLRQKNAQTQKEIEAEEECISNRLMKKLHALQDEKEHLAQQIEQEEEYLTNTLQQQLERVRREKIDLENHLEQEQECIVNKLQRQLDTLRQERTVLRRKVEELSRSTTPRSNVTPSTSLPDSLSHHQRSRSGLSLQPDFAEISSDALNDPPL